jgi:hypothetical protein
MQIPSPFSTFDPKSLKHQGRVPVMLQTSMEKAQRLLNKRSRDEIESMLKDINWMFYHPLPESKETTPLNQEPASTESLARELVDELEDVFKDSPGTLLLERLGKPHI